MQLIATKPKVLLVEDNNNLSENIGELLKIYGYEMLGTYESAEKLLDNIGELKPDLILVDIKLKGKKTGIELANELRSDLNVPIVFITSASGKDIIEKVRHIKPDGFIVKPFSKETLITTIELAIANFRNSPKSDQTTKLVKSGNSNKEIFIRENGWLKKIKISDIHWIKAEGTYSHLFVDGKQYTLRNTAKEILCKLDERNFLRVHKSYIINLEKIEAFNNSIIKIDESEIPIGRNYYKQLINLVNKINN